MINDPEFYITDDEIEIYVMLAATFKCIAWLWDKTECVAIGAYEGNIAIGLHGGICLEKGLQKNRLINGRFLLGGISRARTYDLHDVNAEYYAYILAIYVYSIHSFKIIAPLLDPLFSCPCVNSFNHSRISVAHKVCDLRTG